MAWVDVAGATNSAIPDTPVLHGAEAGAAAEITAVALEPYASGGPHPLPLVASWATGTLPDGFDPNYQLAQISSGHRLLPWFHLTEPGPNHLAASYFEPATVRAALLGLPLTLVSTQWDRLVALELSPRHDFNDPLSPFSPISAWYAAGLRWGRHPMLARMQQLYPSPPRVIFLSNNEQARLSWRDVRQQGLLPADLSDEEVRRRVGDAWIERYRELMRGFRDGLTESSWKNNARFVGYDAFGGVDQFRWDGWIDYSLGVNGRFEPWPAAWDGASVTYYTSDWSATSDYQVFSPQVGANTLVPMRDMAERMRPDFWFELSVWDGQQPGSAQSKDLQYRAEGQVYDATRYEGYVQFGLWLTRPRLIREFRNPDQTRASVGPYFDAVVRAVDRVHDDTALRDFWRNGTLLANDTSPHPYQASVPSEWRDVQRWFVLESDANPARPWSPATRLEVYAIALQLGSDRRREWLVYAHSPLAIEPRSTRVQIPGGPLVKIWSTRSGCFTRVSEAGAPTAIVGC